MLSDEIETVTKKIENDHFGFNPSIVKTETGFLISLRISNALAVRDVSRPKNYRPKDHYSKTLLLFTNNDLNVIKKEWLNTNSLDCLFLNKKICLEDVRLYSNNGICSGIGCCVLVDNDCHKTMQVTFEIDGNVLVNPKVWNSPSGRDIEKNWTPLVSNYELYLAYAIDPFVMMKVDNQVCTLESGNFNIESLKLCGGTPFIKLNDLFLSVAHMVPFFNNKFYYRHVFVVLDKNFEVIEISQPFFIKKRGVEFATGLEIYDDSLYLSYGVADRAGFVSKFSINNLGKYLVSF